MGSDRVFSGLTYALRGLWVDATAHQALRIPDDRRIVLLGYGTDPLVEAFWSRRKALYPLLADMAFDLVLAPNYSMYGNQPRTEHLLNFRRNMVVAAEMLDHGINALPNIYWYRKEDLDRYLSWASDVEPQAIAINLQTFRTTVDWEEMALPGLAFLAAELDEDIKIVITGPSTRDRLRHLVTLFGERMVLVSQSPIQEARHGKVLQGGRPTIVQARPEDAFAQSVRDLSDLMSELQQEAHLEPAAS